MSSGVVAVFRIEEGRAVRDAATCTLANASVARVAFLLARREDSDENSGLVAAAELQSELAMAWARRRAATTSASAPEEP